MNVYKARCQHSDNLQKIQEDLERIKKLTENIEGYLMDIADDSTISEEVK